MATGSVVGDWAYENAVVFIAAAIAVGSFILGPVRIELDRRRTSGSAELEARWEQVRFPNEKTVLRLVVPRRQNDPSEGFGGDNSIA